MPKHRLGAEAELAATPVCHVRDGKIAATSMMIAWITPLTLALTPGTPPVLSQRALMEPLQVVEAQLAALKAGDCRTCFEHASPVNRRVTGPWHRFEAMLRSPDSPYLPLVACTDYEVLSALSMTPRRWQCRVRVEAGGQDYEFSWKLSRQADNKILFDLGQCIKHRNYKYRGVVVGYDDICLMPDEWCIQMGVDNLPGGRSQPYYHVLVDERDRPGQQTTYVAQENVMPQPPQPVDHPYFSQPLFTGELDEEEGLWVPNPLLREQWPRGLEGCWLVDAVMPDIPAES